MAMKSRTYRHACILAAAAAVFAANVQAQPVPPGADVESLLAVAKENNPELATMRHEADAAVQRITPAGALPDPKFRTELRDITRMGNQNPTVLPGRVGSTRYVLMQDVPWSGKRELKREIAEFDAEAAKGRIRVTWSELAARIKTAHAQRYFLHHNRQLLTEILGLMSALEKIAHARYAGGLSAQQDVIRAQVEQTGMKYELIVIENEMQQVEARLNGLLARPAASPLHPPETLRSLPAPASLDPGGLRDRLSTGNPLLFTENSRIRAAEKSRELAYRNRYPDFSLGVSPIQVQGTLREWELMVELNIPLQQSTRRAQEQESEAMLQAAKSRREAAANQMLAELAEQLSAIAAARKTEALAADTLLPQAELTYRAALAGYETGKVDFATLLEAQRQIRQAKQNRIKARAEARIRLAEVERLLGEDL